jgi:hypothetical protein
MESFVISSLKHHATGILNRSTFYITYSAASRITQVLNYLWVSYTRSPTIRSQMQIRPAKAPDLQPQNRLSNFHYCSPNCQENSRCRVKRFSTGLSLSKNGGGCATINHVFTGLWRISSTN